MAIMHGINTYLAIAALVMVYSAAAVLAGDVILRLLNATCINPQHRYVENAAAFLLGQGALGTLWQVLAVFGAFHWWAVAVVLFAAIAWGAVACLPVLFDDGLRTPLPRLSAEERPFALAAIGVMVLLAPLSLLPPGTDALAFYISQPKLIAATHTLTPLISYETFAQLGLSSEMHYAVFFSLAGDHLGWLAGKSFIWVVGVASLVMAWGIGRRLSLEPLGCWFIVILLLTSTAFTLILWDGKTDLLANGLALAALYFLLAPPLSRGDLAASGLATGLACAAKLSFIPSFGLTIGLLLAQRLCRSRQPSAPILARLAVGSLWFAGFAALPFAILVMKNWIVLGEPLAPFILFRSAAPFPLDQVWFSPENARWIVATYPLALVFGRYPMQHGNISVLLLAMCPLLLLPAVRKVANGTVLWLALAGIAGTVAWVVLRPSVLAPRYILPSLLAVTPAIAVAMVWFWRAGAGARVVLAFAVAAPMLFTAIDAVGLMNGHKKYLLTLPTELSSPIWRTADVANSSARPDARVFNLMYYSSMYRADLLTCMMALDPGALKAMQASTSEFWAWLYKRGVTHVSYDILTHKAMLPRPLDPLAAPSWLDVRETSIDERFSSYELVPRTGAPSVETSCGGRKQSDPDGQRGIFSNER